MLRVQQAFHQLYRRNCDPSLPYVLGTEGVTMCHLLAPWKYKHMHSVCMPQHLCKVVFYPPKPGSAYDSWHKFGTATKCGYKSLSTPSLEIYTSKGER